MRILLIEDDDKKAKQIIDFLAELTPTILTHSRSYQSGLESIFTNEYDFVLLDMQLPTFDIQSGEDGYKFRKLAGWDILNELKRKQKQCKIIVVTQFETFGEGADYIELKDLKLRMRNAFGGLYVDSVYYHPSQSIWKSVLQNLLKLSND